MRKPITTDRLLIRDVIEADAELMFELDSDSEVMRYIGPRLGDDASSYRDRIRTAYVLRQIHAWYGVRAVFDRAGDNFFGSISIRPAKESKDAQALGWNRSGEVEIGFRFCRSSWGRGVATEAISPLIEIAIADPSTTAIVAYADANNVASLRVLQKLGLERIGEVLLPDSSEPIIKMSRPSNKSRSIHS